MSEMVERVARALAESQKGRNWDVMPDFGKDWWRVHARAGIAAMRNPTYAMVEGAPFRDVAETTWEFMIDEALR